jgi:hypothetical protein
VVVTEVRQRLSVSKRVAQKFDMERFNLRNLNDVEGKEEFRVKIPIIFAAFENLMIIDIKREHGIYYCTYL